MCTYSKPSLTENKIVIFQPLHAVNMEQNAPLLSTQVTGTDGTHFPFSPDWARLHVVKLTKPISFSFLYLDKVKKINTWYYFYADGQLP